MQLSGCLMLPCTFNVCASMAGQQLGPLLGAGDSCR